MGYVSNRNYHCSIGIDRNTKLGCNAVFLVVNDRDRSAGHRVNLERCFQCQFGQSAKDWSTIGDVEITVVATIGI
ncbi:hypothetical protein Pla22_28970 [Rubripirellula amarantea]|uniref:Uncharacterized protein n=1 Tax=Rubripirellula amarantea TaxID=2527999 RepID=A0A5C5WHW5_9BACT|nr:hypothetical protein Pla22_28970 [Rubripirellula amarantea]